MYRSAGVVGLGTMGAGIAEVLLKTGLSVIGVEADAEALERGRAKLGASLDRQVSKGRLSPEQRSDLLGRLRLESDPGALKDVDLAIEAVPERMEFKRGVFEALDAACGPETVLATNTSSLSIAQIAALTGRPDRVAGMHFFNPAPVMKLVEVIVHPTADPEVARQLRDLAERAGKQPITVTDRPGFVANRLLIGYLNQAAKLVGAGADPAVVDAAMRGAGLPMGPLTLLDVVGLDTAVEILDVVHADSGSPRHEAADVLRELTAAGKLGAKTGHGFYDHSAPSPQAEPDAQEAESLRRELIGPHVGEAQEMVESGYASAEDVDTAMRAGCGYPKGIFALLG